MTHFAKDPRRALIVLIAVTLLLRIGSALLLEAGNDESYNFLYVVYPAWSYFDHPPMTMWIARAGLFLCGDHINLFSIRLGHLLLFAGSTWVLYRLTARWYGGWAGFYAAFALNLTLFYGVGVGVFALPDGPFLFFALLTIWALTEAVVGNPGRTLPWVWVGLAWAGALLSKYHAIFLPAGALLYIAITPRAWRQLLTAGPYLASAIGVLGFTPVLIWNTQNDWASFVFQGSRALDWHVRLDRPLVLMMGTMVSLLPWIWVALARSVYVSLRSRALGETGRLLLCVSIVPLVFFFTISLGRITLVHWPLIAFVPLFCLLGQRWAGLAEARPVRMRLDLGIMGTALVVAIGVIVVQSRFGIVSIDGRDPCSELWGWDAIGEELQAHGLADVPNTFLFTRNWDDSGHLAFALRNRSPVLCYCKGDARGFAYWSQPEDWIGKDGILVCLDDNDVQRLFEVRPYFEKIELATTISIERCGKTFRQAHVFRCHRQLRPFPFTYASANERKPAVVAHGGVLEKEIPQ